MKNNNIENMNNDQLKVVIDELQSEIKKLKKANQSYQLCIERLKSELNELNKFKNKIIKQVKKCK